MARRATKSKKQIKKPAQPAEQKILTTTNTTPLLRSAKVEVLSSKISYKGPLFSIHTDYVLEPGGIESWRDVIHHSGSVVVLAIDESENRRDPYVLIEEQYRHAAGQYLLEIPAGRKEPGEKSLPAAKRELLEETGFKAKRWTKLVRYYASPGFLGEWMQIYLARDLVAGPAMPEEDEFILLRRIPLSAVLKAIDAGKILDGKTLIAVQMLDRMMKKGAL
jgi:ADP-ribose pyrophosphatase